VAYRAPPVERYLGIQSAAESQPEAEALRRSTMRLAGDAVESMPIAWATVNSAVRSLGCAASDGPAASPAHMSTRQLAFPTKFWDDLGRAVIRKIWAQAWRRALASHRTSPREVTLVDGGDSCAVVSPRGETDHHSHLPGDRFCSRHFGKLPLAQK
jgi:hypothetical protein